MDNSEIDTVAATDMMSEVGGMLGNCEMKAMISTLEQSKMQNSGASILSYMY